MASATAIDDQPINATFFNEGRWLTEFVTPDALEVTELYKALAAKAGDSHENIIRAVHAWVAGEIKYKAYISARLTIEGKTSINHDTWLQPSLTRMVKVGNCANKSFLAASLLRNVFSPGEVHVVLGNLYNGKVFGHSWVQVNLDGRAFIIETTRPDVPALIPADSVSRYEAVHFFNDESSWVIEGLTAMKPFAACYSTWLKDYLHWSYING